MASKAQGKGKTAFTRFHATWNAALVEAGASGLEYAAFAALTRYPPKYGTYSRSQEDLCRETGMSAAQASEALRRLRKDRLFMMGGEMRPILKLAKKPCKGHPTRYQVCVPETFEEWDRTPPRHGPSPWQPHDETRYERMREHYEQHMREASEPINNAWADATSNQADNAWADATSNNGPMHGFEQPNAWGGNDECLGYQHTPIEDKTIKSGGVKSSIGGGASPQDATPPAHLLEGRGGGMFGTMPRATIEKVDPKTDPRFVEVPGSPDFDGIPIAYTDRIPGLTLYLAVDGNLYTYSGGWHRLVS